ncbi:MAG: helix-turn-helix domain-containing protein [Solirubrobacterales bacterium]|nr:helix-turn-helix domain-containing protein [Solirubrobacterales bacterium]
MTTTLTRGHAASHNEQALLRAAQRGDRQAQEELLRRYEPLVRHTVWRLPLPCRCDREDFAQDARLALLAADALARVTYTASPHRSSTMPRRQPAGSRSLSTKRMPIPPPPRELSPTPSPSCWSCACSLTSPATATDRPGPVVSSGTPSRVLAAV